MRRRIIMNAGSSWVYVFVTSVVGIVLVPIMINSMGVRLFGVWALLSSGLNYPIILQGAFGLAINRSVAFYRDDVDQVNQVVAASFIILLGMAVLCVLASIAVSFVLTDMFASIPLEYAADARRTCILVGLTLAVSMIQANFSGVLMGFQNYLASNMVSSGAMVLRAVLTVVMLRFSQTATAVQFAFFVAIALSNVAMMVIAWRAVPGFSVRPRHLSRSATLELLRFTGHSLARSGSTIAMQTTMTLLVGWKGTAVDVAVYNVATRIPSVLRGFFAAAQNVFLPAVTTLSARGEAQNVKALVKRGTHMNAVVTCLTSLLLVAFAPELLQLWLKGAVPQETVQVMRWLVWSVVPGGLFELWLPVLVGVGHLRGLSIASMVTAGSAIVVQLVLMHGVCSPAMAPAVALVIVLWAKTGLWLPLYGIRKMGIGLGEYLAGTLRQPLLATALSAAFLWIVPRHLANTTSSRLALLTGSFAVVCFIFVAVALRREVGELTMSLRKRAAVRGDSA